MPDTNANNMGKVAHITQRHEPFLISLKTNPMKALRRSNVAEQMICPSGVFIFSTGGHVQQKSCRGFLFLLLKVLI